MIANCFSLAVAVQRRQGMKAIRQKENPGECTLIKKNDDKHEQETAK